MICIAQQFVRLVIPVYNIQARIGVVADGEHDCKGGKHILIVPEEIGRITAVIVKAIANSRTIATIIGTIRHEDTSAVIGKIGSTHNVKSFRVTPDIMQKPCQSPVRV